jgi:Fe-S-cluster containining protein
MIRPHLGKGVNEPTSIFTYQHTENVCIHLKDNLCKIYNNRPLICRSFPIKVAPIGLTFSPGCKGFLEIVKNSKTRNREMEEIQSALEIAERLYKFHSDFKDNERKWRYNLINEVWDPYGFM